MKDYESGGITQSLNAFNVSMGTELSGGDTVRQFITFIDTPGHSAFGDMRLRGICAADIAVIVIAADDGIMDQTKECITACRRQGCPFIVAINKVMTSSSLIACLCSTVGYFLSPSVLHVMFFVLPSLKTID